MGLRGFLPGGLRALQGWVAALLAMACLAAPRAEVLPDAGDLADRLLIQGSLAEMQGDLAQAAAAYHRLLELDVAPPVAAEALFRISLQMEHEEGMGRAGDWLVDRHPQSREAGIWLDHLYANNRQEDLHRRLQAAPDTLFEHLRIQILLDPGADDERQAMRSAAELEARLGRQLRLDRDAWQRRGLRPRLFWEQALAYALRHGRSEQVCAWIDSSRLAAEEPAAWLVAGRLAAYREDLPGLRRAIDKGRALDSLEAFYPLMAGRLALMDGEAETALKELRTARQLDPQDPDIISMLAVALEETGRLDEAESLMRVLLAMEPGDEDLWMRLAGLLQRQGRRQESLSIYGRAMERLDGQVSAMFKNNYSYALAQEGAELPKALILARAAVAEEPESAAFRDTLGWLLFLQGHYADAEAELQRAYDLCLGVLDPEILEHLGHLRQSQGRSEEASALWRKALELDPGNEMLKGRLAVPMEGGR